MNQDPSREIIETGAQIELLKNAYIELFAGTILDGVVDAGRLAELLDIEVSGIKDGKERFGLMWAGRQKAVEALQAPSFASLVPDLENSVNWHNAENVFVEGDNLEVLKLLQKAYNDQVKLIYIDPPYNTGNDFVYNDDFSDPKQHYLEVTGQVDAQGNRLVANTEVSGRKHSNWLTMMYPRLSLARNLLKQDGIIAISIDDSEVHNLSLLMNEIFGEENFVGQITRVTNLGGTQPKFIRKVHDYVLIYARNLESAEFGGIEQPDKNLTLQDERGPYAKGRELNKWGAGARRVDAPTMWFPIAGPDGSDVYPIRNDGSEGRWRFGRDSLTRMVQQGDVHWERRANGSWLPFEKIREVKAKPKAFNTLWDKNYTNAAGTERLKELLKAPLAPFDYAKPVRLVQDLCQMVGFGEDDLVLDFFAGSATTADAVLQMNSLDGGRRKFLLVNLDEETQQKSVARDLGYEFVSQVSRLRIMAAEEEFGLGGTTKFFRLGASSFVDSQLENDELSLFSSTADIVSVEPTRILSEVSLSLGMPLHAQFEEVDAELGAWYFDGLAIVLGRPELDSILTLLSAKKPSVLACMEDWFAGKDDLRSNLYFACKKANVTLKTF